MKIRRSGIILFAITFAFVEASVVVYLRQLSLYEPLLQDSGYQMFLNLRLIAFLFPTNFSIPNSIIRVEMMREFSTLVMLASVAVIYGRTIEQKFGAFLMAFALWDLFYYVFLGLLIGWPKSLIDQDIFFLLPVPWIGPVMTPILISLCLFLLGRWFTNLDKPPLSLLQLREIFRKNS